MSCTDKQGKIYNDGNMMHRFLHCNGDRLNSLLLYILRKTCIVLNLYSSYTQLLRIPCVGHVALLITQGRFEYVMAILRQRPLQSSNTITDFQKLNYASVFRTGSNKYGCDARSNYMFVQCAALFVVTILVSGSAWTSKDCHIIRSPTLYELTSILTLRLLMSYIYILSTHS